MVKGLGVGSGLWSGLRLRFMVKGLGVGWLWFTCSENLIGMTNEVIWSVS